MNSHLTSNSIQALVFISSLDLDKAGVLVISTKVVLLLRTHVLKWQAKDTCLGGVKGFPEPIILNPNLISNKPASVLQQTWESI